MVQLSQTSWQEFSLPNVIESLQFAPLNLKIQKNPQLHYVFPKDLAAGSIIHYTLQFGFKTIKWTGIISCVKENKITVRLGEGPFRGFTGSHSFKSIGNMTECIDELSFQGFITIPEDVFANILGQASIIYGIFARKDARDVILAFEASKKTQSIEALNQSATAG